MDNINIKDIAKIAGVGVSTVSRVINNHPDVKGETRERIMKIISEYNYIPNNSARNLKRNVAKDIGVLVKGGIYNPFFSRIIHNIEEKINEKGYSMILHYNFDNTSDIDAAIELIKEKKLKGLICLGGEFDHINEEQMESINTPIVLVSTKPVEDVNKKFFSSVIIDDEKAAYEAVDYLCKLGHQRIGIIAKRENDISIGVRRLEGYKKALKKYGIPYDAAFVEEGEYTFESGYQAMERLLDKGLELTAVFAISDVMAIGAAKAILKRGLRIPEDISVVGFDGIDYAKYFHPSITTVKQPGENMGQKSAEILFSMIKKKAEKQHVVLKTKLLEGESCKSIL
ncbi:MAG: LacI family DNA-binding transcriptional regulator [Bacillota bacterium]